jgi:hypothetical protein
MTSHAEPENDREGDREGSRYPILPLITSRAVPAKPGSSRLTASLAAFEQTERLWKSRVVDHARACVSGRLAIKCDSEPGIFGDTCSRVGAKGGCGHDFLSSFHSWSRTRGRDDIAGLRRASKAAVV